MQTNTNERILPRGVPKAAIWQANIGEDYWDCDFNNYEGPPEAAKAVYEYLSDLKQYKEEGIGLLFAGRPGRGKTTLMAVVLKYLVRARWKCYMTSLSELVETIKRSWDDKELTSTIDHCKSVDFLGIDDLGKEHQGPTGFSAVTFDNLLRHRVQHRLPTFFTTNLDRGQIGARYGDSTLSLIEGKTKIVAVNGQDFRTEILRHEIR